MNKPKVLILLATYNGARWLIEQIESILDQEDVYVEIVARDDGSSDETCKILENYSNIKKIESSFSTGSAGGNFRELIKQSTYQDFDYVGFSDQDDIWFSRKLIEGVAKMVEGGYDGYSCSVEAFGSGFSGKIVSQSSCLRKADFLFEGAGQGCSFLINRELMVEIREFILKNETICSKFYYHDWLVYLLARCWGKKWFFDPAPYVLYRQHANNDTGSRNRLSGIFSRLKKIKNGWYGQQITSAIEICSAASKENDLMVQKLSALLRGEKTAKNKFLKSIMVLRFGRRKFFDRVVLAYSALFGLI